MPVLAAVATILISNPFVSAHPSGPGKESEGVSCVSAALEVTKFTRSGYFSGRLEVVNQCSQPIALLLAPIETRIRRQGDRSVVWYNTYESVFAQLFIAPHPKGWKGLQELDGMLPVFVDPEYSVIAEGIKVSVPLSGQIVSTLRFEPGVYEVYLQSYVVPTVTGTAPAPGIQLENTVAKHNGDRKNQPELWLKPEVSVLQTKPRLFRVE